MGDLGAPGSVVEMIDAGRAEESVGGAQGRPQHHDEPEGRRQAGELHRGLRRAARASRRLHRRAHGDIRQARHARHLVRARLGRNAARAADSRHAPGRTRGRSKYHARHRRGGGGARARYRGAYSGEHGDGLCRGEWIEWQFGAELYQAFRAIKQELDPIGLFNPGKIIDPPKMDDAALFRFAPPSAPHPYRTIALAPVLDWSAWNVQNDPLTENLTARQRRRQYRRLRQGRRDVQQQRPVPPVRCRHHVPELPGHPRRAACDARPRQHAATGALRSARRRCLDGPAVRAALDLCVSCKGCKRECPTGVDMARMKIEFLAHYKARHGHTLRDRLFARLPDYARS
jgi:NAD-dependent dihydropyrimidine dehydrogenase PreA subunit